MRCRVIIYLFQCNKEKTNWCMPRERQEGEFIMTNNSNEKFCVKCGKKFLAVGREVICPSCKQAAAEDAKRAAVMRAKRASWTGESVPVRISGRASAVIRAYSAANGMPFAEALDELLKASAFFKSTGTAWQDVEPYKSRRRKSTTENTTETAGKQDAPQDKQDAPQEVKTASKPQDKPQTAQAAKATSKKTSSKSSSKPSKSSSTKKG